MIKNELVSHLLQKFIKFVVVFGLPWAVNFFAAHYPEYANLSVSGVLYLGLAWLSKTGWIIPAVLE